MFLAIDVGNSTLKGGLFDGTDLTRVFNVSVAAADQSTTAWDEALEPHLDGVAIDQVGLSSVVPPTARAVRTALRQYTDAAVVAVRPGMSLPFTLAYDTPDTLGMDRLAAAAAGWVEHGRASAPSRSVLVVDAGTAVTCEVVHRNGTYQGGVIAAGPALVQRALQAGTAQLPDVPLTLPDDPVGRSTTTALQSGIMWGLIDAVNGMTTRLAAHLPDPPHVVATGGWSELLTDHLTPTPRRDAHLVLEGIRVLVDG